METRKTIVKSKAVRCFTFLLLFLFILFPVRYAIERLKFFDVYEREPQWTKDYKKVKLKIGNKKNLVLDVEYPVEFMFYTGSIAYSKKDLTNEEKTKVRKEGFQLYEYDHNTGSVIAVPL